jgi:hypothetical protein
VGDPTPVVPRSMDPGLAEAFEITGTNRGFMILDAQGALHAIGDASPGLAGMKFKAHVVRDLELTSDDRGAMVLDGFGTIHTFGDVPEHFGSVYFGTIWRPMTRARTSRWDTIPLAT